jgi:hypothetical protein
MIKAIKLLFATASVALLAACGGGGDSGGSGLSCFGNRSAGNYNVTGGGSTNLYSCVPSGGTSTQVNNTGTCCQKYTYDPVTQRYTSFRIPIGDNCTNAEAGFPCGN